MGRGKREPLPYNVRFTAWPDLRLNLWFWLNQPTIWTLLEAVVEIRPFPSSSRPPRASYFFDYCYL